MFGMLNLLRPNGTETDGGGAKEDEEPILEELTM